MGKPSAPRAPDPIETGRAQTGTNVSTAIANQLGNMVNQVTPYGSLSYDQSGTFQFTDPTTGTTYDLPRFTATQSLTPAGQAIQDNVMGAQTAMSGAAQTAAQRMQGLMGQGINTASLPARAAAPTLSRAPAGNYAARGNIADAGGVQRGIAGAGDGIRNNISGAGQGIRSTYSIADRGQVEQALMSRIDPQLAQDRATRENNLRQQGITPGSAAWDREMNTLNQQSTDARMQAILAGGQEQSRLAGLYGQQAQFENAAQAQLFGQVATAGQFANAAQAQRFGQVAAAGQFANAAQAQQFGQNAARTSVFNDAQGANYQRAMGNSAFNNQAALDQYRLADQARSGALQEQVGLRNQQMNEIQALLGGSQVQSPNFVNTPGLNMPTTDYAGLIQQNYANRMGQYQQQMSNWNGLWGGLLGLGGSAMTGFM